MENVIATYRKDSQTLRIFYDTDCENPRDWDNTGKIYAPNSRYNFADDSTEFFGCTYIDKLSDQAIRKLTIQLIMADKSALSEYKDYFANWLGTPYGQSEAEIRRDFLSEYFCDDMPENVDLLIDILEQENILVVLPLYMYEHSGISLNTTGFSCSWDSGRIGYIFAEIIDQPAKYYTDILRQEIATLSAWAGGECYYFVLSENDDMIDSCAGFIGDYQQIFDHIGENENDWDQE